jgi:hypothetical protein
MKTLLLALLLFCHGLISAGPVIGSVSTNKGTSCEIERGSSKLPGLKGAAVESMDTYRTGSCVSDIVFKDDTKVKVTENSRLVIDDFVYDPKQGDAGKLAMRVGMGTVRYASGQIAKQNPQQVSIKTPTANIAVRGTDFTMTVDETGRSLVVLLPSCKDQADVKTYELEENRCRVGEILVSTGGGEVLLSLPFQATYVISNAVAPATAFVMNTIESKLNNNLILVHPREVDRVLRNASGKTKRDEEIDDLETEAARRLAQAVAERSDNIEQARILILEDAASKAGCNATTTVCISWDNPAESAMQNRGKGIAFRNTENTHYAEVKTQGYTSNTSVTITHNDAASTAIIGDGSVGGNVVSITQNIGVAKR